MSTSVSHTEFKTWRSCPRKWQLKYRDENWPTDESIHFIFGTAVHETIQKYLRVLYKDSIQAASKLDLVDDLRDRMFESFEEKREDWDEDVEFPITKKQMVKAAKDGGDILRHLKSNRSKYFPVQSTTLSGIEHKVFEEIKNGIHWRGYLDIVLYNEDTGKYKIIDLKTSKDGWDKWKRKEKKRTDQLLAYKLYFAQELGIRPSMVDIEYLILKRNKGNFGRFQSFEPPSGDEALSRVESKINEFISSCYNEDGSKKEGEFKKDPDKFKCAFCPFSQQHGQMPFCDHNTFLDYPESMDPYVDSKFVGPQPELNES